MWYLETSVGWVYSLQNVGWIRQDSKFQQVYKPGKGVYASKKFQAG